MPTVLNSSRHWSQAHITNPPTHVARSISIEGEHQREAAPVNSNAQPPAVNRLVAGSNPARGAK
jgi:hypothetical protein